MKCWEALYTHHSMKALCGTFEWTCPKAEGLFLGSVFIAQGINMWTSFPAFNVSRINFFA